MGELRIVGNTRTKDKVIRREAVMAGSCPARSSTRTGSTSTSSGCRALGYFHDEPRDGQADRDQDRQPAAQGQALWRPDDAAPGRGRDAGADAGPGLERGAGSGARAACPVPGNVPRLEAGIELRRRRAGPFGSGNLFSPPPDTMPPIEVPAARAAGPAVARPAPGAGPRGARRSGPASRRDVPQHPRPEHDRRRARPQRSRSPTARSPTS